MAILKPTILKFDASTSPDVVGNALYIRKVEDGPVDEPDADGRYLAARFLIGNEPGPDGVCSVDLAGIEGFPTEDANYNIGVAAIDDFGNEASMSVLPNVPLDFAAPNPVTNLRLA